jgi:hypothetical protein
VADVEGRTGDEVDVLFIAGMGRSGSTLLSRLLGQVPGMCSVGELCYLWDQGLLNDRMCGCGQAFSQCPFWTEVGRHAFGGWDQVDARAAFALRRSIERMRFVPALATRVSGAGFRSRLAAYTELTSRVYAGIRQASGADVVVDSSKYPSSAYVAMRTPGIALRLVHLIRTSQGVAFSWAKVVSRPDRDGKPLARFSPTRVAFDWDVYNSLVELLRVFRVPRLQLRYEDFMAEPEPQLRRVLDFAGIPPDVPLDFLHGDEVDLRVTHTVAGNPMRFREGRERLVRDDVWRSAMPAPARRLVTALTLPGLLRYGYRDHGDAA